MKNRELVALRAIIKCIEEYKLQKECPLGPLQKRINELKPKGAKRPSGSANRNYAKKQRVSGGGTSAPRRPTVAAPRRPAAPVGTWQQRAPPPVPAYPDRYGVAADRYHYAPPPAAAYDAATYAAYGGGGEQYRAAAPKPYQYNPGSAAAAAAAASYNNIPQYKVVYGGPGAQPSTAAAGYAPYGGGLVGQQQPQPAASSGGYLSYAAGFGYRPSQQQ